MEQMALKGVSLLIEMFEADHPEHRGGLRHQAGGLFITDAARPVFVAWAARLRGVSTAEVERTFGLGPGGPPAMTSFLPPETPEERDDRENREGLRLAVRDFLADHPEHAGGVKFETTDDGRPDVWIKPDTGKAFTKWSAEKGLLTPEQALGMTHAFQNIDRAIDGKPEPNPSGDWIGRK